MQIDHMHVPVWQKAIARIVMIVLRLVRNAQTIHGRSVLRHMKSCGHGVGVWGRFHVTGADNMVVGHNVHFGDNAFIRAEGGLEIGDNTHISRNLVLYTINHDYDGTRLPYDQNMIRKPVTIGRNVWIGMNVCIAPGTVIGDGAIIALGTSVSGNIPSMAIVGGGKRRMLGERDRAKYESLEAARAYGGPDGVSFQLEDRKD